MEKIQEVQQDGLKAIEECSNLVVIISLPEEQIPFKTVLLLSLAPLVKIISSLKILK